MKGKGPVESEGFMNALSSQAAKMKEKKRKISKVCIYCQYACEYSKHLTDAYHNNDIFWIHSRNFAPRN